MSKNVYATRTKYHYRVVDTFYHKSKFKTSKEFNFYKNIPIIDNGSNYHQE